MLYQLSYSRSNGLDRGGGGRIRTSEGVSRQIYSLFPLTAREPPHADQKIRMGDPPNHRGTLGAGERT